MTHSNTLAFPQRLRQETALLHATLEELPLSKSITNPAVTKDEYAQYLIAMHDVVTDAERNIFPLLKNTVPDLERRAKAGLLEDDLRFLGVEKSGGMKVFNVDDPSEGFAMGILYVMEGSSLGGRIILKNISSSLGYTDAAGAKYFAGYGGDTGPYWKSFVAMLESYAEAEGNEEEIIEGANFAFNAIRKYFE